MRTRLSADNFGDVTVNSILLPDASHGLDVVDITFPTSSGIGGNRLLAAQSCALAIEVPAAHSTAQIAAITAQFRWSTMAPRWLNGVMLAREVNYNPDD
jgi:hypothetical protein